MDVGISNQWVAENCERIFAHTPAYHADTPLAGRESAKETLRAMVSSRSGARCAIISDLLGAGKTFFLWHAFADFGRKRGDDPPLINEQTDKTELIIDDVITDSCLSDLEARVVVVEELDRKAERSNIKAAVQMVSEWLRDDRLAILTGDFCLRDPELLAMLDERGGVRHIPLEPLDGNLLFEAIESRLDHWLQQAKVEQGAALAMATDAVAAMFHPEVLHALLPPTNPPVATFREVLGVLQNLAEYLPLDTQACRFTADTYRAWRCTSFRPRQWSASQEQFIRALHDQIRAVRDGHVLGPMDMDRTPWLAELVSGAAEGYRAEVLEPLARAGVLLPMGIPFAGQTATRYPGPYLPTVGAFLDALLGEGEL